MSQVKKALVAGIMIGELGSYCARVEERRRSYPTIELRMCDLKAVQLVREAWGRPALLRGIPGGCPTTTDNPEGRAYVVRRRGKPAANIMKEYAQLLKGHRALERWRKVQAQCPP